MVDKVDGNEVTLKEFKENASFFSPFKSKILIKGGKVIARYNAKTKKVKVIKR